MPETWLRESMVRLPALGMLETWLQESGIPRQGTFLDSVFFVSNYHASFVNADNSLIVYRISTSACHA